MTQIFWWAIWAAILTYLIAELIVGDKELREKGVDADDGLILPVRLIEFIKRKLTSAEKGERK